MNSFNITVIVPSHNYGRFLSQCLQSILGQTRRPDEIIVVDDRSTDDTREVAELYFGSGIVRYLRVDHGDPNLSRQSGFEASTGELVCCVDADDWIDPLYLEKAIELFRGNPNIGIVYSDVVLVGGDYESCLYPGSTRERDLSITNYIHAGAVVRRDVVVMADAFNNGKSLLRYEDWAFWRKIVTLGFEGVKQSSRYYYRKHPDGKSVEMHIGFGGYSYAKSTAFESEKITLFTPLSGRSQYWGKYSRFLERQDWDHSLIKLILCDSSGNPEFGRMVQEWLARSDYSDYHYFKLEVGKCGLADEKRTDEYGAPRLELLGDVRMAMARIYNRVRQLVTTNYLWILEDDIIPPLDVVEELMRGFTPDTASVSAPYPHRYAHGQLAWQRDGELLQGGTGLEDVWGNGFGCVIVRSSLFKATPFTYTGYMEDCDSGFYDTLPANWRRRMHWDYPCQHLSPLHREQKVATTVILTEENFDEDFYINRYPDVKMGLERGVIASAWVHYVEHGRRENRVSRAIKQELPDTLPE